MANFNGFGLLNLYLWPPPIYFFIQLAVAPFLKLQSDQISPFDGFSRKTWADFPSVVHSPQSSIHLSSHLPPSPLTCVSGIDHSKLLGESLFLLLSLTG